MALKDYPDWVLIHKGKGKEIRCINGNYYLYLVHSKRIDGKVKKFTDKYLGKITEAGLIPPVEKVVEYLVKKVGLTAFIFSSCHNIIQNIKSRYPARYKKLLPLAILKYFFSNNLEEFNHHYVSILFPNISLKTEVDSIKNEVDRICSMFDHATTKAISPLSLEQFKHLISNAYIVGVKDKWTLAHLDENTKNTMNKYKINMESSYGESK